MLFFNQVKIKDRIANIVLKALALGLTGEKKIIIEEYLEYNEFGLALEHLLYEIYENKIIISIEFYQEICEISKCMNLPEEDYKYVYDLVR